MRIVVGRGQVLSAVLVVGLGAMCCPGDARAAGFVGRLALGPSYMKTDSVHEYGDSSGPALALQLDAGLKVMPLLALHGTLIYDYSSWLSTGGAHEHSGSMLGLGLGATLSVLGISLGVAAGGQFTNFAQADDPASGPHGASLGPFISASAGYELELVDGFPMGLHLLGRLRRSKDETNGIVYDPVGYQIGVVASVGIDGDR